MTVKSHFIFSGPPAIGIYLESRSVLAVAAFLFGSIFIDVDHYMEYVSTTGDHSLVKAYRYCIDIDRKFADGTRKEPIFHYFHCIEFFMVILVLSIFYPYAIWLSLGLVLHFAMDMFHIIKDLHVGVRQYSLIAYLLKRGQAQNTK